ncbi:MAG: hypothetical protein LBJ61_07165 [Deltaproteobacteria bacterium]|nr:hypothetical protein [Deltaproteobacteria bacterium]
MPDEEDVKQDKFMAALSYLGILFLIPLLCRPRSGYVRVHTTNGILINILYFAVLAPFLVGLITPLRGIFWTGILTLLVAEFVFSIVCVVYVYSGKIFIIPFLKKYLF